MNMSNRSKKLAALLKLSHELGDPRLPLAILGEGNTSVRLDGKTFLVKASGCNLGSLTRDGVVECRMDVLLALLDRKKIDDAEVHAELMKSRVDARAKKPSVEALFHAWLLTLPGIEFVGHTHAEAVTAILSSPRARALAEKRVFPDEIVCCDMASVFVPYTDPGLRLAQEIRTRTEAFMRRHDRPPRVVLLANHGIITLGRSTEAVLAAMLMAEKAARIRLGAAALGVTVYLTAKHTARIGGRADEALRRKALKL
jgi:rhamnose utilization protein RhaD (predicted bifunctional aldolase and dehydrogenase)